MTPEKVAKRFAERVRGLVRHHEELLLAVHQKRREVTLQNLLCEQLIVAVASQWEAFVHEFFIACAAESPGRFLGDVEARIRESIEAKFGIAVTSRVRFDTERALSAAHARAIVDPKGRNVSAASLDKLRTRASQSLSPQRARGLAFTADVDAQLELLVSLRNYVVHGSADARQRLKMAAADVASHPQCQEFVGVATKLGPYLRTMDTAQRTIAARLALRVADIIAAVP